MFSKFTTDDGTLLIRTVDIRSLIDTTRGCRLTWEAVAGQEGDALIHNTADENLDRLKAEETAALNAAEQQRQRSEQILRGRQAMRMVPHER